MTRTLAASLALVAGAATASAETPQPVRGLASSVEVEYEPRLKAKAEQSPSSPVMVRVSPSQTPGRQRVEFIGMVAGSFDLREYVEREDGRDLQGLPSIPVTVVSQLPPDHGTDLYNSGERGFNWRTHYTQLMWGGAALWLAIPAGVLVSRALRKRRLTAQALEPTPLTLEDQLRTALDAARDRTLTIEERGQLELLVFRFLSEGRVTSAGGFQSVAQAFHDVRQHPETRELVAAIEQWLHVKEGGDAARADAKAALEAFRQSRVRTAPALAQPTGVRA